MFAFSISVHYLCDAFHIYYLFCKTATMYVRIWSRILSVVDRESVWGWRTIPSNVHSVGPSLRRFAKIIIHGENLHFSFNNLFYNLFDDWNKNPWFFVSWYSWMFPNCFILVLLDFVWYCYHQLSSISFSFLFWSLYVTLGRYVSCWC